MEKVEFENLADLSMYAANLSSRPLILEGEMLSIPIIVNFSRLCLNFTFCLSLQRCAVNACLDTQIVTGQA